MPNIDTVRNWQGATMIDRDGDRIGQAGASGDHVQVPFEKQRVKDAPNMDPDGHLSEQEEQELWRHYGLEYGGGYAAAGTAGDTGTGRAAADDDRDTVGRDVSGPTTDDAMTRSEEEL